jgi:predicted transcriptional regulator of viral defense system
MPAAIDRAIGAIAERQHGCVTRAQLTSLGLNKDQITYRVKVGRLHRVHRGVYSVGRPPKTALERASGAVLACGPGAALSHRSALALWGLGPWPWTIAVTQQAGAFTAASRSTAPRGSSAATSVART